MGTSVQISVYKNYISSTVTLGAIIILIIFGATFLSAENSNNYHEKLLFNAVFNSDKKEYQLQNFNPNSYTLEQWQSIGFSEKQAATILKYKEVVGGSFSSKAQFQKCYAVSEAKFQELRPFIMLPEKGNESFAAFDFQKNKTSQISVHKKFNPDQYSVQDWMNLGFSKKQAVSIMKYKNYLGGSFRSKEKFRECFIISEENYNKLSKYLILPETSSYPELKDDENGFRKTEKLKINYVPFDPNSLDEFGWIKLGFSEKQATTILNYKNKFLKGSFKSAEDLEKCFVISEEKYNEMKPFMIFPSTKNNETGNVNTNSARNDNVTSKTDFSRTDLNQITYKQLIEFGFDEKAAASLIGFRNKLGGFINKEQILETYNTDRTLTQKLVNTSLLNIGGVKKYHLTDAPEKWLKEHPYFKYSADKILYFRITYTDDKKIFKMMKLKPEYEQKMKLYLLP